MRNRKKALQVFVDVRAPSVVELTVQERVQIDRVRATERGAVVERHGKLLEPGVHTLALAAGQFFFKTMSDADLRVVSGGVTAHSGGGGTKRLPPAETDPNAPPPYAGQRGDDPPGALPTLTVS